MPRNGSGVYSPPAASYPAVSGTLIESADRNAIDADIATAITNSIAVNGESVVTNNIPFGGNKLTGVAPATVRTDAMTLANVQDGTGLYVATVGGTADVITISPNPSVPAYVAGQEFSFIASGANTTNVTINVSGLGAKAITKNGTTALVAGDIPSGFLVTVKYDGTRFQLVGSTSTAFNGGTVTNPISVPDDAYAVGWNGSVQVPTKNAVYDKIESLGTVPTAAIESEIRTGTNTAKFATANAINDAFGFSAYFESADQTITSAGALTIAHGLVRKPILIFGVLKCTTAEWNYSINDEVAISFGATDAASLIGISVVPDVTNLNVRFGSAAIPFLVQDKTTGIAQFITLARWRLVLRAWA